MGPLYESMGGVNNVSVTYHNITVLVFYEVFRDKFQYQQIK